MWTRRLLIPLFYFIIFLKRKILHVYNISCTLCLRRRRPDKYLFYNNQLGHWGGILLCTFLTVHLTGSHWFIFFSKQSFKKICENSIPETLFMPALFWTKLCVGQPSKQIGLASLRAYRNFAELQCNSLLFWRKGFKWPYFPGWIGWQSKICHAFVTGSYSQNISCWYWIKRTLILSIKTKITLYYCYLFSFFYNWLLSMKWRNCLLYLPSSAPLCISKGFVLKTAIFK